jgi:hypothetical protein
MYDDLEHQTAQAAKSAHLKTTFDSAVKEMFTDYNVDLTAPEETTGGGVRARQHIRLVANDGRSLVIGSANAAEGTAELRTLGCTLEISKQRFGVELPIPSPEYMKFLERATDCLGVFGMKVSVISTVSAARAKDDE